MFEFAIAQQQKHPPSRRFLVSMIASIIGHFLAMMLLIEYPQLLGKGLRIWIRHPIFYTASAPKEPEWRTVAVLGDKKSKLMMPSATILKELTYDWESHKDKGVSPPIRIRWNGDAADGAANKNAPIPKPVPGLQEPKPLPSVAGSEIPSAKTDVPPGGDGTGSGSVAGAGANLASGRTGTVYLPAPPPAEPKPVPSKPAEAAMVAPGSIPKEAPAAMPSANLSKGTSPATAKPQQAQVFENEQKAIRSEGTGFFDTRGFPLGEYATAIIERVKGNWSIPSNLRNHQGRTTVIFFIDKDGRCTEAHIVNASGSNSLDLAALNAIIGSNPFPPLPKGFPGERVGAKFVFAYNERQ